MSSRRYLDVAAVAERYGYSSWQVYERARRNLLPCRKHPGGSRLLFLETDLDAFDDGAPLEVTRLARGGKVVKPNRKVAA